MKINYGDILEFLPQLGEEKYVKVRDSYDTMRSIYVNIATK